MLGRTPRARSTSRAFCTNALLMPPRAIMRSHCRFHAVRPPSPRLSGREKVERYRQAARRESTQRRYRQALEHFEATWSGFLPATSEVVARYLADYADTLASQLNPACESRCPGQAASQSGICGSDQGAARAGSPPWHPSPASPARTPGRAEPLQLSELTRCIDWLLEQEVTDSHALLHCRRDRALILLGFWRAFRSDDLCRLPRWSLSRRCQGRAWSCSYPAAKAIARTWGDHSPCRR